MECKEVYLQLLSESVFCPINWPSSTPLCHSPPPLPRSSSAAGFIHLSPHNSLLIPTVILCVDQWSLSAGKKVASLARAKRLITSAMAALNQEMGGNDWPYSSTDDHTPQPEIQSYVLKGCNGSRLNAFEEFATKIDAESKKETIRNLAATCFAWSTDGSNTKPIEPVRTSHTARMRAARNLWRLAADRDADSII